MTSKGVVEDTLSNRYPMNTTINQISKGKHMGFVTINLKGNNNHNNNGKTFEMVLS
jgi:hypothetical protein